MIQRRRIVQVIPVDETEENDMLTTLDQIIEMLCATIAH